MLLHEKRGLSLLTILTILSVAMLAGCGRNGRQSVEGSVTLDGKPLADATISFQPVPGNSGGTSGAATDDDGKFSIPAKKGLVAGKYMVTIQKWKGTGQTFKDGRTGKLHEVTAPIAFKEAGKLEVNLVAGGPNQFQFDLTSTK